MDDLRVNAFRLNSRNAIADESLQKVLQASQGNFVTKRRAALREMGDFAEARARASAVRDRALDNLPELLEQFERNVLAAGGHVHWAQDARSARAIIRRLCADVTLITKSKSMVAEEIGLGPSLEAAGIEVVETDLGEYIIQLRGEAPSHLIAPALHVSAQQVESAFRRAHTNLDPARDLTDPASLLAEARHRLREKFLRCDVGITGANLLVAETGSVGIVTNEGNADLGACLPDRHIVLTSIEKVVGTMADAAAILRVLPRSATGQPATVYTSFVTGARRSDDRDGPRSFHVVLLDNHRSSVLGTPFRSILKCIRCAACLNHCPVYSAVGGHAYGSVYPGPMGVVLTPALVGARAGGLTASASSFCGRCDGVCPVGIPLTSLMREWRGQTYKHKSRSWSERCIYGAWRMCVTRIWLYGVLSAIAVRALHALSRKRGVLPRWLQAGNWAVGRLAPSPQSGATFQVGWRRERKTREAAGRREREFAEPRK